MMIFLRIVGFINGSIINELKVRVTPSNQLKHCSSPSPNQFSHFASSRRPGSKFHCFVFTLVHIGRKELCPVVFWNSHWICHICHGSWLRIMSVPSRTTRGWFPDTDPLAPTPAVIQLFYWWTEGEWYIPNNIWAHNRHIDSVDEQFITCPLVVVIPTAGKSPRNGSTIVMMRDFPACHVWLPEGFPAISLISRWWKIDPAVSVCHLFKNSLVDKSVHHGSEKSWNIPIDWLVSLPREPICKKTSHFSKDFPMADILKHVKHC